MFEHSNPKDKTTLSLGLGTRLKQSVPSRLPTATAAPAVAPKTDAKPGVVPPCLVQTQTLEGTLMHFTGARRKFEEMVRTGVKPEFLFYLVYPQQGLSHSITTGDGLKTIVTVFTSKPAVDAYIASNKSAAVAAVCRIETLPQQAERWTSSGINSYALNVCSRCGAASFYPIVELTSEESFVSTWRLDLANRRQFAETYGRNCAAIFATNPKQARIWLEGVRDHVDPANPYLHWMIALLAGMAGDMEANGASIKRLEAFGPPFLGKLKGTSFDPTVPGSQLSTMAEAMVGLGVSLGYIDPGKMVQAPKL